MLVPRPAILSLAAAVCLTIAAGAAADPPSAPPPPKPPASAPKGPGQPPSAASGKAALLAQIASLRAERQDQASRLAELEKVKATWKHDLAAATQIDRGIIAPEKAPGGPVDPKGGAADDFKPIYVPPHAAPALAALKGAGERFDKARAGLRSALKDKSPAKVVGELSKVDPYSLYPKDIGPAMLAVDSAFKAFYEAKDLASGKAALAQLEKALGALEAKIGAAK